MYRIPKNVRNLLAELSKEFSASVWERFVQLIVASIVLRAGDLSGDYSTAAASN
jgi:hypothetical protein